MTLQKQKKNVAKLTIHPLSLFDCKRSTWGENPNIGKYTLNVWHLISRKTKQQDIIYGIIGRKFSTGPIKL